MTPVIVHFDGLCEPERPGGRRNPGGSACGGWVVYPHPDVPALPHAITSGREYARGAGATNNLAEYEAALDALRAVYRTGWRGPVTLRGDSQLVVKQTTGEWACNAPHLIGLWDKLREAMTHFERVDIEWVPRAENEAADAASRRAYEKARNASKGAA